MVSKKRIETQITQLEDDLIELDLMSSQTNLNVFFEPKNFEVFKSAVNKVKVHVKCANILVSIEREGRLFFLAVDDGNCHALFVFTSEKWERFKKVVNDFRRESPAPLTIRLQEFTFRKEKVQLDKTVKTEDETLPEAADHKEEER